MSYIVLGMCSSNRSGKDYFATVVCSLYEKYGFNGYSRFASGDALKQELLEAYPWLDRDMLRSNERYKSLTRPLQQSLGEVRRQLFGEDYWISRIAKMFPPKCDDRVVLVVTDITYENEAQFLRNTYGNLTLVRLNRTDPGFVSDDPNIHVSNYNRVNIPTDLTYDNDCTYKCMERIVNDVLERVRSK